MNKRLGVSALQLLSCKGTASINTTTHSTTHLWNLGLATTRASFAFTTCSSSARVYNVTFETPSRSRRSSWCRACRPKSPTNGFDDRSDHTIHHPCPKGRGLAIAVAYSKRAGSVHSDHRIRTQHPTRWTTNDRALPRRARTPTTSPSPSTFRSSRLPPGSGTRDFPGSQPPRQCSSSKKRSESSSRRGRPMTTSA